MEELKLYAIKLEMISGEVGRNEKEMIFRFRRIRKHFEWGLWGLGGGRCAYLVSNDKLSSVSGPRLIVPPDTLVYLYFLLLAYS